MSRTFNRTQKQFIFISADGKCQLCGNPLDDTWEADHIKPYSKGGPTEINNGQALCQKCNREKGNNLIMFEPRKWQWLFVEEYSIKREQGQRDFLLVATPGAGKTKATLYLIKGLLAKIVNQIIIVVPTEQLKLQWHKEAESFGISLYPKWTGGTIKKGYHGIVITYAQVANNGQMLNLLCQHSPTFAVFDEVHHAGDSLAWGNGIKEGFFNATLRLSESGTPFRSDNNKIPFVTYNQDGESKADFIYNYRDAIFDSVCRSISFPAFDGMTSWFDGDEIIEVESFDDPLDSKQESQRLRAALDTGNEFITSMIKDADKLLDDIRKDDPTAGGLIVTIDIKHADAIARIVKGITRQEPTVVYSDPTEENANYLINDFAGDPSKKWIIAVKMISEGVDIKRLRVGVYATNVVTELTFRQIVGRVVRRQGDDDLWAHFFVPKDSRLVEFMERIKEERDHIVNEDVAKIERNGNDDYVRKDSDFIPVDAQRRPDNDIVIAEEKVFTQTEVNQALILMKKVGIKADYAQAALLMREIKGIEISNKPIQERSVNSRWEKENSLRKAITKQIAAIAYRMKESHSTIKQPGEIIARIHGAWMKLPGHNKQENASLEELEEKLKWLPQIEGEYWRFI